jgi:UDP-glucose:(heptosyl)LPS alpha-1,3-glucosyltransferase
VRLAIVRRRHAAFGGAERFIENVAGRLADAGHRLAMVSESWPASGRDKDNVERIPVPPRGLTRAGKLANFQREVAAVVAGGQFDLVQTHERLVTADIFRAGDGVHAAWLERLAAAQGGVKNIVRRLGPMHRLITATERKMARDTDMVFVANSELVAGEIADWLDVPKPRIRIIENGVDTSVFHPPSPSQRAAARRKFNLDADDPVVAFVGSGFDRKGAFRLVEALALPQCSRLRALIAGRDRRENALRRRAGRLGLAGRVRILGGVDDPLAVYHAADLFALPSLYDPMPNAALEALACGLPLLVTADTGIANAVRDSGAGVVTTRSPDHIAHGLLDIVARRDAMSKAAIALTPRFNLDDATARWLALYRELA